MSAELLPYYEHELSFIRHLAAQFGREHERQAGLLKLNTNTGESQDPHVERLIEAFAFLTARVRLKLDDEFPEITDSFLGVLYPHYQAPLPSLAVVQLGLDPEQRDLGTGHAVPRHTGLETEPLDGDPVRFRTCYPVTLWQVRVEEAGLSRPPFPAPAALAGAAAARLRLALRCDAEGGFAALAGLDRLRFFLLGEPQHVYRLYELIFNDVLGLTLAAPGGPADGPLLDPSLLRPVGFEREEGLLPYTARSFAGYRLLTEFFAFPEKFLFVDLTGLSKRLPAGERLEVCLYLRRALPDLEPRVKAETFRLGCTPVVNLYPQRAEPIALTHTEHEYRVVPDARRPRAHEVYSVDRVTATAPDGRAEEYQPFFSIKHAAATGERYWHASRQPSLATVGPPDHGTEVHLALTDLDMRPATAGGQTLDVETTCLSRDLPHRLPFGGGQPRLQLTPGDGLVTGIACLTAPTRTLRPALRRGALWRLISHLALGHLSLVDHGDNAEALREILKLYDFADSPQTRRVIDGLRGVTSRRAVGRVDGATFCRGVEVTLLFDEDHFTGSGVFLFAAVLERFLGLYCTLNSFTKLVARIKGGAGELRRWPPRLGERVLT
jgi:type VI secretion system protein ImpG